MKLSIAEIRGNLIALAEDAQGALHDITPAVGGAFALSQMGLIPFIRQGAATWVQLERDLQRQGSPISPDQLADARPLPPVIWPTKVVCVGQNYADHCREQNVTPPETPVIFSKFPQSIIGPGDSIIYPVVTRRLDYEVELAVIIGRKARHVKATEAMDYVFGYSIGNDITARDIQKRDGQWIRAKGCDTFCPLGPCIRTAASLPDVSNLRLRSFVNGQPRQDSTTAQMIFSIPFLIEWCSAAFTLHPGDVILTGTPPGVGAYMNPPGLLQPGDVVRVEIESIGSMENNVVAESAQA